MDNYQPSAGIENWMSTVWSDKQSACSAVDKESGNLRALSLDIWEHPELAFQEHHAHQVITDFLEEKGFQVKRRFIVDTAFRATVSSKDADADTPHFAVLCEYDALPSIGHACGHNLIAMVGVAIALGIKEAFDHAGVKGKLTVLGCPAEESGGGKIDLIEAGVFSDIDFVMMAHPSQYNLPKPILAARMPVDVQFEGLAVHAATFPWDGINALDAAVLCYQNVSCMRQQMKPSWRVHGVITDGGEKPNILPGKTELQFYARTPTKKELEILKQKLIACINGAATASGCKVEYTFDPKTYEPLISNDIMASLYEKNGESLGLKFEKDATLLQGASSDVGNVSSVVPSIQPAYSLNTMIALHSEGFRDVAKTEESHELSLQHAKALAMTAVDIYKDLSLVTMIKDEFKTMMADED